MRMALRLSAMIQGEAACAIAGPLQAAPAYPSVHAR